MFGVFMCVLEIFSVINLGDVYMRHCYYRFVNKINQSLILIVILFIDLGKFCTFVRWL